MVARWPRSLRELRLWNARAHPSDAPVGALQPHVVKIENANLLDLPLREAKKYLEALGWDLKLIAQRDTMKIELETGRPMLLRSLREIRESRSLSRAQAMQRMGFRTSAGLGQIEAPQPGVNLRMDTLVKYIEVLKGVLSAYAVYEDGFYELCVGECRVGLQNIEALRVQRRLTMTHVAEAVKHWLPAHGRIDELESTDINYVHLKPLVNYIKATGGELRLTATFPDDSFIINIEELVA